MSQDGLSPSVNDLSGKFGCRVIFSSLVAGVGLPQVLHSIIDSAGALLDAFKTASAGLLWMSEAAAAEINIYDPATSQSGGMGCLSLFGCPVSDIMMSAALVFFMYSMVSYTGALLGSAAAQRAQHRAMEP